MSMTLAMSTHMYELADRIADTIQHSDAARRFWQARDKMERNESAQALFEELKRKTNNSFVIRDTLSTEHPMYKQATSQMDALENRLAEIPVAMQYKEAQDELNGLMQEVVQLLLRRISTVVPVEPGPKQGCGKECSCGDH